MEIPNDLEAQLSLFNDILSWKSEEQQFAGTLAAIENAGFTTSVQDLVKPCVEILDRRVGECILATNHLSMEDGHHERLLAKIQQAIQLMEAQKALVQEHRSKIKNAMTAVANQQSLLVAQRTRLFAEETAVENQQSLYAAQRTRLFADETESADVEPMMRTADETRNTRRNIVKRLWVKERIEEKRAKKCAKRLLWLQSQNDEQDEHANEPNINNEEQAEDDDEPEIMNEEQDDVHMHGCASHEGIALADLLSRPHEELLAILSKYIDADPFRMQVVEQWLPTWNTLKKHHWAS
ncbi:hypothetical protein QBC37DRAFT_380059 [Rhypophila decipiens]|uniref:Uncharacterized protein n=1 Tax=Rhypophila decipiens TaxID=261697 RepID=A0AAN6XZP5_9PEZI|nr:hypothetical protein QBC37DRAFT_380059 [Rhypophila decipiens]